MRKEYELSEEDYQCLIGACRAVPYIFIGGVNPISPQENANRAWKTLGEKLGFAYMSVQSVGGKSAHFFTAEELLEGKDV